MGRGLFLTIAFAGLALWGVFFSLSGQSDPLGPWAFSPAPTRTVPLPPESEHDITRIAFDGRDLWVLTVSSRLWRVNAASGAVTEVAVAHPVLGICADNSRSVVLTEGDAGRGWRLQRYVSGVTTDLPISRSPDEQFAGLACGSADDVLVTSTRLLLLGPDRVVSVPLKGGIPLRGENSVLATDAAIWVGSNIGEFGGGLRRIDRKTGKVNVIAPTVRGAICGLPLDAECDPVTALAAVPGRPDCVLATIGLVHMSSHGRLIEACGAASVRRLMIHPCPQQPKDWRRARGDNEPACTAAMFGLAQGDQRLIAVTNLGLMEIAGSGAHGLIALPQFKTYGPFKLSFRDPDYVLALTGSNGRFSLSGETPLIVAR